MAFIAGASRQMRLGSDGVVVRVAAMNPRCVSTKARSYKR